MTTPVCRTDSASREAAAPKGCSAVETGAAHPERSARLACDLSPSRLLQGVVVLMAFLSVLLLTLSRLPWGLVAVAVPAILVFAHCEWRRGARYEGRLTTSERRWYWQRRGGAKREIHFCGELTVWRWLIVINGRDLDGKRMRLVLCRDGADADDWRRLLVALRYSR
ncbi:protein YgfX [uncultured Microbulbifer sp.]|uniref:protein YgfX n=1 Tax=uncultured Microbulbifer sp. TaxID=348147 RepID=UPI00260C9094|nr:protein YgfX [uncultured Microbulbifer sp.]